MSLSYLEIFGVASTAILVFQAYKYFRNKSYFEELYSSDPLSKFENYKWLGFSKRMSATSAMSHAVEIGMLSKLEHKILWEQFRIESMSGWDWASVVYFEGDWFGGRIDRISFRFGQFDKKLLEARIYYRNLTGKVFPEYDITKEYERLERTISKTRGESKSWKDIGISIMEIGNQDRIAVNLFFTPPDK